MQPPPDLAERHKNEVDYFDHVGTHRERQTSDFRILDLKGHEPLFSSIEYLVPVNSFFGDIRGARVLDLGCGNGWITLRLGESGAHAVGVDISPALARLGSRYAEANGLQQSVTFAAMPAEALIFDDAIFDCVLMHASLHHCDVQLAVKEVKRVLKPGGKAVFVEDYAYHPLMRIYRLVSKHRHTRFEKALDDDDLEFIRRMFSSCEVSHYGLVNLFFASNHRLLKQVRPLLSSVDKALMRLWPGSRRYTKLVCIRATK